VGMGETLDILASLERWGADREEPGVLSVCIKYDTTVARRPVLCQ